MWIFGRCCSKTVAGGKPWVWISGVLLAVFPSASNSFWNIWTDNLEIVIKTQQKHNIFVQLLKVFNQELKSPCSSGSQMLLFLSAMAHRLALQRQIKLLLFPQALFEDVLGRISPSSILHSLCLLHGGLCWWEFPGRWEARGDSSGKIKPCSNNFSFLPCQSSPDTAVGHWGRCFHIYLLSWDMKPKVSSLVQGQMSREKFCSFGTCCVKPSLLIIFFKKSQFWFQYPKKRQQCCQSYLLISEIIKKKTKYSGKCLICRLEWMRLLENNTVFWNIWRNIWVFLFTCDGTSSFNNAALLQQLHLWSSSHFLQRPELTLTSPFVRWVWKS